ncbi:MAG: DUF4157 domain-containing protein [Spirulina sp. SIO3F2]|nr:DUF4157 domain-containing protein [Spirulina sp. SIO3F2]
MKKHISKPTWQAPTAQAKTDEKKRQANPQHPIGNFAPNALMDSVTTAPSNELPVQAKLTIGQVGDQYEQEADTVAAKVVQQINAPSSDAAAQAKEEEQVQLKPALQRQDLGGGTAAPELEAEISQAKGGGQALDKGLQRSMGNTMGMDLSHVKVHTDNTAHQLNQSLQAKAFTTGQDVFFGKGQYQPGSKSGQELIAHELTHVGQQTDSGVQRQPDNIVQCFKFSDLFTPIPKQKCSATAKQGIKYINFCKKYPPIKWSVEDFAQINKAGHVRIIDWTKFEIASYACEATYSTENTNLMLLASRLNWMNPYHLLSVAEILPRDLPFSRKYTSYLPNIKYVAGGVPDGGFNMPSRENSKLIAAITGLETAMNGTDKGKRLFAHKELGESLGNAIKAGIENVRGSMTSVLTKMEPEQLFSKGAALIKDLKKVRGGTLKSQILNYE